MVLWQRNLKWKGDPEQSNLDANMNREHVSMLRFFLVALTGLLGASVHAADKPDILLLMPDQMRGDCLSILGHPVVHTPTLDALAHDGVLFRRAYSPVPSCIPARFALLTGLSPRASGVVGYAGKAITALTLPECLANAGYATVLVGRNMHQLPVNGNCGYQQQILGSTYVADDDYDLELKRAEPSSGGIRGLVAKLELNNNLWPAKPWPLDEELHPTRWIVSKSRAIVSQTSIERPLFLTVSFYAPHPPLFPPARFFNEYLEAKLPPVAFGSWVDRSRLTTAGDKNGHRVLLQGDTLRRAQAGYFGLIEQLDEAIAGLIEDFKVRSNRTGRPWLIVLTSDHGEMLGDHGYFRKCEPYEGSANIPLIISGSPELGLSRAQLSFEPVSLQDLMPTLLELAGVPKPVGPDGISLVMVLRGKKTVVRDWLHFEHATCYSAQQAFHALTDGRVKYIWRPKDGSEQLFDLETNIHEEHDLSEDPNHNPELKACRMRLIKLLAGRPEGFSDGERLIAGRPYPPLQERSAP